MGVNRRPITDYRESGHDIVIKSQDGSTSIKIIDLLGSGGTCLAYKGMLNKDGDQKYVVVKEYYPSEDNLYVKYCRNESDGKIEIKASADEERIEEIKRQKDNVERELKNNKSLFLKDTSNSAYMYNSELFCTYGDSSYIVIDTSEGITLKDLLSEEYYKEKSIRERVELAIDFTRRFLIILENVFSGRYIHGDLKPDNIYIAGNKGAENIFFLDFGSVFALEEYKMDLENASNEEKIKLANRIIWNEGIGMSSEEYRNYPIIKLIQEKNNYYSMQGSVISAESLIKAVNNVGISSDIYSLVKVFFRMIAGVEYSNDINTRKMSDLLGEEDILTEDLLRIMKKNENEGYSNVADFMEELDILNCLLNNEGHPKVLLYGLMRENENLDVDQDLFGAVVAVEQ